MDLDNKIEEYSNIKAGLIKSAISRSMRQSQKMSAQQAQTLVDTLKRIEVDVSKILKGIPYRVVGGWAISHLIQRPRMTRDFDIMVDAKDRPRVQERLRNAGFTPEPLYLPEAAEIDAETWNAPNGNILDVLYLKAKWAKEAFSDLPEKGRFQSNQPLLAVPWLILLKLIAGRMQDLTDIISLIGELTTKDTIIIFHKIKPYAKDVDDMKNIFLTSLLEKGVKEEDLPKELLEWD